MAMSPYRFAIKEPTAQGMKSRTGLAGVTTGGATSGGEGFRASALRPGSSGYMAAGFGAAPRTDYVKPVVETPAPPPAPPAPEPAPTLAPELADPSAGANARGGNVAEGDGANGGADGLGGSALGAPTDGWLADLMANIGLTNPGYGYDGDYGPQLPGASTQPGGQADVDGEAAMGVGGYDGSYGPQLPGDWGGGAGTSSGAPSGGGTMGGGQSAVDAEAMSGYGGGAPTSGQGAVDAEAASGGAPGASGSQSDADAAAEAEAAGGGGAPGGGPSGPDQAGVEGYAKGGFVKGRAPMRPGAPKGLAQVGGRNMGGYADGGSVGMSPDDVNAALWRRAQGQTAPTPEMIEASRAANFPRELSNRNSIRSAENNARTDAWVNARFGADPQFRPEAVFLGDPSYVTDAGRGTQDALTWLAAEQARRAAIGANPNMVEGAPLGADHRYYRPRYSSPQFMGAYAGGGSVPNYAEGGMVDEAALAGPNPAGPDDGFAALDGGEYVVQAQQAQRPDYAPILAAMNAGAYQPGMEGEEEGGEEEGDDGMMPGMMPAEGHTTGDPGALPPDQQRALMDAMMADPVLAQALAQLLGPDAAHSLVDSTEETSPAPIATGRPPLAGPPPIPGAHAPPGVRPPAKAMPTQPMPPMPPRPMPGAGLGGVMA